VSEKAGAKLLLRRSGQFPAYRRFSAGGYDGKDFMASVKEDYQLDWEVKRKQAKDSGLALAVDSRNNSRAC